MIPLPSEQKLKNYLLRIDKYDDLPMWAEIEPGSFLYVVKEIWEREQDRDGRRGHLSEQKIADEIAKLTHRKFSRNQYQAMFGAGRKEQKTRQDVPEDIAEAFLFVAFTNWSFGHADEDENGNTKSIFSDINFDYDELVVKIIDLMYAANRSVKCVPTPGMGPKGFYEDCRKRNRSVIIATRKEHIVVNDPAVGLKEWINNIRILFKYLHEPDYNMMHIWAIKEPLLSDDPRSISVLHDIGLLKTAFLVARSIYLVEDGLASWQELSRKCLVVMFLNRANDKHRTEEVPDSSNEDRMIYHDFIFPDQVPLNWAARGDEKLSMDNINIITTLGEDPQGDIQVSYNIFEQKENSKNPPVIEKSSPSEASDKSFQNLYRACRQYIEETNDDVLQQALKNATDHRWKVMTAAEFLNFRIP